MTRKTTSRLLLAAAVAAALGAPMAPAPAAAQDEGVSVTIRKGPTYLNTRTTPRPRSYSPAAYDTKAQYQPTYRQRNSLAFSRYPLPSTFDVPGF